MCIRDSPNIMHSLVGGITRYLGTPPLIVGAGTKTGIRIITESPKEIGPDRIVDAVAAYEKYGGPVLVPVSYTHLEVYKRQALS